MHCTFFLLYPVSQLIGPIRDSTPDSTSPIPSCPIYSSLGLQIAPVAARNSQYQPFSAFTHLLGKVVSCMSSPQGLPLADMET